MRWAWSPGRVVASCRLASGEPFGQVDRSDIDLRAKMLTVNQARVLVECKVWIEEPKSRDGHRKLRSTPARGGAIGAAEAADDRERGCW